MKEFDTENWDYLGINTIDLTPTDDFVFVMALLEKAKENMYNQLGVSADRLSQNCKETEQ